MAEIVDLGVGKFQIGGKPEESPPRVHFYQCDHNFPIGADVLPEHKSAEPIVTLIFHSPETIDAMIRALQITRTWFDKPVIYETRIVE